MLTFAMDQDWIRPARRVKKPGEERSRDRVLTRDKLRELWTALHQTEATDAEGKSIPRLSQTLNDMLIVMLLTAQSRRSLPHALAEGRSAHGLVDDSGGHIQERRCASRPADAMTLANLRLHADEPHADRSWPERGNLLTTEKCSTTSCLVPTREYKRISKRSRCPSSDRRVSIQLDSRFDYLLLDMNTRFDSEA